MKLSGRKAKKLARRIGHDFREVEYDAIRSLLQEHGIKGALARLDAARAAADAELAACKFDADCRRELGYVPPPATEAIEDD